MYFGRKTNKKAVIITAAAAVVIVALLVILNTTLSNRTQKAIDMSSQTGTEPETEAKRYLHMTLYQSDAGAVTFNPAALLSTDEQKAVYSVTAPGEVELQIQPVEGKLFESAEVKTSDFMLAAYDVTDKGIRFVMPEQDVFVTISYRDDEEWLARQTEVPTELPTELVTEPVTEPITEAPAEPLTEPATEVSTEFPTEPMTERKTEIPETESVVTAQEEVNIGDGGGSFSAPAPVSSYTAPRTVTTTTTLTLQNVSTVFLGFVEDSQGFSNQVTNYIFNRGLTGNLTGDFAAYEIDPEAQTATFSIIVSTGGTISGTFDKNRNAYLFNG